MWDKNEPECDKTVPSHEWATALQPSPARATERGQELTLWLWSVQRPPKACVSKTWSPAHDTPGRHWKPRKWALLEVWWSLGVWSLPLPHVPHHDVLPTTGSKATKLGAPGWNPLKPCVTVNFPPYKLVLSGVLQQQWKP
jgi:hypothetical protein